MNLTLRLGKKEVSSCLRKFLDLFFPIFCLHCKKKSSWILCPDCLESIEPDFFQIDKTVYCFSKQSAFYSLFAYAKKNPVFISHASSLFAYFFLCRYNRSIKIYLDKKKPYYYKKFITESAKLLQLQITYEKKDALIIEENFSKGEMVLFF